MLSARRIVKRFTRVLPRPLAPRRSLMFLWLYISAHIRRFVKNEEAASAIEYAVIATMVAIVVISFVTPLGNAVKDKFNDIVTGLGGKAI